MTDSDSQNTAASENKSKSSGGMGSSILCLLFLIILGMFVWQSCQPITCQQAKANLEKAKDEMDKVTKEVTGDGTGFPHDEDSLTKSRIAANHVLEAEKAEYEACKSSN